MKLVQNNLLLNQPGTVTIVPEHLDDLWLLYNLIARGDVILSKTSRKVYDISSKGSTRVILQLEIKIIDITYEKDSPIMRVKGKTISENPHVAAGSFHTVEIENNKQFTLTKKIWDSESLSKLSNETTDADLAAIPMQKTTAMENRVFKKFLEMLLENSDRACYGPKNVEVAHEFNAVETLLISEDLVKSEETEKRQKYVELVKSVKSVGGKALVYSSKHVFGEQLATLTGIAAILRFPLPDLDDMVM